MCEEGSERGEEKRNEEKGEEKTKKNKGREGTKGEDWSRIRACQMTVK